MIRAALDRPVSTTVATITLIVLGVFALLRLPVALLPEVDRPVLRIDATAEGRSADELLNGLTIPLERRLASIEGVRAISSSTDTGTVRLTLESDWQVDPDRMQIEVSRRIQDAGELQPDSIRVSSVDPADTPILEIAVTGGSNVARTAFVENTLLPEISRVRGAGLLTTVGMTPAHVEIELSSADLSARGVTALDVQQRLVNLGSVQAAGLVRDGAATRTLVLIEPVESLEAIRRISIPSSSGNVPLGEIARVGVREDLSNGRFSLDGTPGVLVSIHRGPQSNVVTLAAESRQVIESLEGRLLHGIELHLLTDRSREISVAIRDLAIAALAGLLLGTFLLRWMLGHWRTTLALSAVIPASIFTAMLAFYFFGVPLDIVSISGLALAAGMLVDNSIVVADSIETARTEGSARPELDGTRRIVRPVIVSTLTTMMVFLPFMFLRGLARAFFGEQAFAVIVSIAASLLFSLTLTPLLCRRYTTSSRESSIGTSHYGNLLDLAFRRKFLVMAVTTLLVTVMLAAPLLMKREIFPKTNEKLVTAELELPPFLTEEETSRRFDRLKQRLRTFAADREDIDRTFVFLHPVTGRDTMKGRVVLHVSRTGDPAAVQSALEQDFSVPGVRARVRRGTSALVESLGTSHDLELIAMASDSEKAANLANRTRQALADRSIPARESIERVSEPAMALRWDRQRLSDLEESPAALEQQVAASLTRHEVGHSELEGVRSAMWITWDDLDPRSVPLRLSSGEIAPTGALAQFDWTDRPPAIERVSLKAAERLTIVDDSRDPFEISSILASLPLSGGEELLLSGSALDLRLSFQDLGVALVLSLILVYLVLAAAYESLTIPPLIMITVPIAAAGALLSLTLTGQTLNLLSLIGIIVLGGIVVNNAIVLVDRAEHMRSELGAAFAARRAATERFRPILLTTLTTLCGMLPLALMGGEGVELRRALATAVVGGLVASLFASLIIVPLMYPWIRREGRR